MRSFIGLIGLIILSSCGPKIKQPRIILYTDTPESLTLELTRLFEETHGIEVEEVMEGTSWLMSRLRAEKAYPIADVFMGASGTVPGVIGAREGLFASYRPKGWEALSVRDGKLLLRDKDWKWVAFGFASLGLAYSRSTTPTKDLPKTWEELGNPAWKETLTIWDPSISGTASLFLATSMSRFIQRGESEEEAWRFLAGFYRSIKRYAEEGPPAFSVGKGIVRLGVHLDNQFIFYKEQLKNPKEKESLEYYLPQQSAILADPVALVAGAPNPQEAKLFIDFLLSPEAQKILSSTFWIRSPDGRVSLPERHPYASRGAGALLAQAMDLDFDWLSNNFDRIRIYWQNHIEN